MKIPKIIFLPHHYEIGLRNVYFYTLPMCVIFLCFIGTYFPIGLFLPIHTMIDIPAIGLFCLFFAKNRFWNISVFFILCSFFEHEYHITAGSSVFFYGSFSLIIYSFLRLREDYFHNYFLLMICFFMLYGLNLLLYFMMMQNFDAQITLTYIVKHLSYMIILYPILFYPLYVLLVHVNKRHSDL